MTVLPEVPPIRIDNNKVARIGETRVTLDTIVSAFNEGATPEEIAQQYSSLQLADIYATIGYYLKHCAEVNDYLQKRLGVAKEVQEENEKRFDPHGVRARLLARQNRVA